MLLFCMVVSIIKDMNDNQIKHQVETIESFNGIGGEGYMLSKELMTYFNEETKFEDLGNEQLIIQNEVYGRAIGAAINQDKMIEFSCELSRNLLEMDVYKASVVANFIGFACEKNEDTSAGKGVVDLLIKACGLVEEFFGYFADEEGEVELPENLDFAKMYEENSQCVRAYYGFNNLCVAAMAFLARDNECREYLRSFEGIKDSLYFLAMEAPQTPYTKSVFYINRVFDTCGKLPLLVLDIERKQGFFAEAKDIDNCFHLLFLLEEEMCGKVANAYGMENWEFDEDLSALAHGEYPQCGDKSYTTCFTELNYGEYIWKKQNAGKEDVNPNEWLNFLIWGEMSPLNIQDLDGYAVIMIERNGPSRSFSPGFLCVGHTALQPYVKIERALSEQEYEEWVSKLDSL